LEQSSCTVVIEADGAGLIRGATPRWDGTVTSSSHNTPEGGNKLDLTSTYSDGILEMADNLPEKLPIERKEVGNSPTAKASSRHVKRLK